MRVPGVNRSRGCPQDPSLAEHDVATPDPSARSVAAFLCTFFHHAAKVLFLLEITVLWHLEESKAPMRREITRGNTVTLVSCLSFIRVESAASRPHNSLHPRRELSVIKGYD